MDFIILIQSWVLHQDGNSTILKKLLNLKKQEIFFNIEVRFHSKTMKEFPTLKAVLIVDLQILVCSAAEEVAAECL